MSKRVVAIVVAALLLPILAVAVFYGIAAYIERQRIADATPAFQPLERHGVLILSQPIPFHRHCLYILEFSHESGLSDDNVHELSCLNSLPRKNTLEVFIQSPDVTDRALTVLLSIDTFDVLDVTDTSISDDGIIKLRQALPRCIVPERKNPQPPTKRGR